MSHLTARTPRRRGFSYLETQVASVLFMMTLAGVVPLYVIQTRQLSRIEGRFEPAQTQYLNPPEGHWARKLGAPAILSDKPPAPIDPKVIAPAYGVITVDDRDPGYSEQNRELADWYHFGWSAAYGSDFTLNFPDGVDDRAIWEFTKLPAGKYDLFVTYPIFAFANQDAEYEFFLNGMEEGHKKVDQTKSLDNPPVDGVLWKKLDTIKVKTNNATLRVELSDLKAKGYNVIDALRLVPEEPEMFLHEVEAPLDEDYLEVRVHLNYSVDTDEVARAEEKAAAKKAAEEEAAAKAEEKAEEKAAKDAADAAEKAANDAADAADKADKAAKDAADKADKAAKDAAATADKAAKDAAAAAAAAAKAAEEAAKAAAKVKK